MERSKNVCTAEEMAAAVGWTIEELDKRFEEYERGDWHLEPETKIYKGSVADFINGKTQSARACFILPPDEKNAAEAVAEEQDITFSKFCRKAVKEAVKKWQTEKKRNLPKVAV